jgi:hypothetical protein
MQTLSTADGSADAVRDAADAVTMFGDNRHALERELDRLNVAIQGSAAALGTHLSWLLVSQSFLFAAYTVVLVAGWNLPLPGKRWLLAGVAGFALFAIFATYLGLRAARDRIGPLKAQRQRVEDALERVAGRPPAFARQGAFTALLAQASTRGLPLAMCVGWTAIVLYTLALPLPVDSPRAAAADRPAPISAGTPAVAAPGAAKGTTKSAPAAAAAQKPVTETPPETPRARSDEETGVLGFFRRALNAPSAPAEAGEPVKP